ncbi:class II aldolase/adducin family protein [Francisella sciaenopsi]|uniref:Class II aldolase/adducin family protein n=1 Tax=Francisella sciaenopsi TaxID=3055034 RepID=A0ABQ6PEC6_9GAMM
MKNNFICVKEVVSAKEWEVRVKLAAAYRAVYYLGYEQSIFAHISARVPNEDAILLNPFGLAFDEITASSLVKVNSKKEIVIDNGYGLNEAGWNIHSGVLFSKPNINCALHLHTTDGVAVSAQKCGFLPLSQDGLLFYNDIAYHDYEGVVVSTEEPKRMVENLGDNKILVLRNHGSLFVGKSIEEAFFIMYNYEKACTEQIKALSGGGVDGVIQVSDAIVKAVPAERDIVIDHLSNSSNEHSYDAIYDSWIRRMKRLFPDFDQ